MDLEFKEPEGDGFATFGDLQRFVKKGEAGGVEADHPLLLEYNDRDEVTGFSVFLRDF